VTPGELADRLDSAANRLPIEMQRAQEQIGAEGVLIAHKWSSGGRTLPQLAADDHPYATRHGHYTGSALINRQSGSFFSDWYYDGGAHALRNPHGSSLQYGTRTMSARDVLGAIRDELRLIARRHVKAALKRSLRG